MNDINSGNLNPQERVAIFSLASIMSLRMIGLFMVLPVFTLYAQQLRGATPLLIGLAMGIYGLTQALFQIPLGALSDRFGRKPIILIGLLIFALGSLIAGTAHSIQLMILGRTLQGMGAIGSTLLALMADLTREVQRTKAMAIAGISIGFSFSIAMVIGPLLLKWFNVNQLFFLATLLGITAILVLYIYVPKAEAIRWHRDAEPERHSFFELLIAPQLAKLNCGIFILHAIFTACFVVIPISLYQQVGLSTHQQWWLYLPTLLIAFLLTLLIIGLSERNEKIKPYFLGAILSLTISLLLFFLSPHHLSFFVLGLCIFFVGFSLLEAFLPSLISKEAPANQKGSALGIYSCAQFLGIFIGGIFGGWLYGHFSFSGVYFFCIILALFWFILAFYMQPPRYLITQMLRLSPNKQAAWESNIAKLRGVPGMVEVTFVPEDGIAYLKMEKQTKEHSDFIRLKEQLQSDHYLGD